MTADPKANQQTDWIGSKFSGLQTNSVQSTDYGVSRF